MTRSKRSVSAKQRRNKRRTTHPPKRKQSSKKSTKSNVTATTKRHRKSNGCACCNDKTNNKQKRTNCPQKEVTATVTAVATADSPSTTHVNDEDEDAPVPDLVDLPESSSDEEDDSDNDGYGSDDEDQLHGPCGLKPARSDFNAWECLIGKSIAKEFLPAYGDLMELYTGKITDYDQRKRKFVIKYSDGEMTQVDYKESVELNQFFEYWYSIVSQNGQRYTRSQATPYLKKAHARATLLTFTKNTNPKDLQEALQDKEKDDDLIAITIYKMQARTTTCDYVRVCINLCVCLFLQVAGLKQELARLHLSDDGGKLTLQQRLTDYYKVKLPTKEEAARFKKRQSKHGAEWERKEIDTAAEPFADQSFNGDSLKRHLKGWPQRLPSERECYDFFFTPDMWQLAGARRVQQVPIVRCFTKSSSTVDS